MKMMGIPARAGIPIPISSITNRADSSINELRRLHPDLDGLHDDANERTHTSTNCARTLTNCTGHSRTAHGH